MGAVLGSKIDPKILGGPSGFRSCDRLVPRWLQDRPKRALGVVLGSSWEGLGPLLGALGPSLEGLGGLLGRLEGVLGSFGTVLAAHEGLGRFWSFWKAIRGLDSSIQFMMRFVDSIRSFDRSIALHHVVDTSRLNNCARRNARSD